jgi:hypothetical protein
MAIQAADVRRDIDQPYGSILGIIDSDPEARLPRVAKDTGGNPRGIEVRLRATGTRHLHQGTGFVSTDMGAGGDGVGLDADIGLERFFAR